MNADDLKSEIVRISHLFYLRGWSLATSGNFSARLDNSTILITASGKDKGLLVPEDILSIDLEEGTRNEVGRAKPSAESVLHGELYRFDPQIGAVLHTHSAFATLVSSSPNFKAPLSIGGYEMLKALSGVSTHVHTENVPVFPNDQNMKLLAENVLRYLETDRLIHAFLIVGHGLYCWGATLADALRHTEALEFLLECEYRRSAK
jgi:methylthioribulose-1-phosphate dehydratase